MCFSRPVIYSQPTFVKIDNDFEWVQPLQKALADAHGQPETQTVWLLDEEVTHHKMHLLKILLQHNSNGVPGLAVCLRQEYEQKVPRVRFLVNADYKEGDTPALNEQQRRQITRANLLDNIMRSGRWGSLRHVPIEGGKRHSPHSTHNLNRCAYAPHALRVREHNRAR